MDGPILPCPGDTQPDSQQCCADLHLSRNSDPASSESSQECGTSQGGGNQAGQCHPGHGRVEPRAEWVPQCSNARWPCTEPISTNSPWGGHRWGGSVPTAHPGQRQGAVSLLTAVPTAPPAAGKRVVLHAGSSDHTHRHVCARLIGHTAHTQLRLCTRMYMLTKRGLHAHTRAQLAWHTHTHTRASSLPAQPDAAILPPAPGAAGEAPALPCPQFVSCIWWSSSSWDSTAAVLGGFRGKNWDRSCHCRARGTGRAELWLRMEWEVRGSSSTV